MLEDVKGKGKKGEVKDFPNGFANFLIKQNKAMDATPGNMNKLKAQQAEEEKQAELRLEEAKKLKADLEQKTVIVKVKSGDNGRVFGSVSTKAIAEEFQKQFGIKLDKRKMDLEAASALLTKTLAILNENAQSYENRKDDLGKGMYEKYTGNISILTTCKENVDFVIAVLTDYINQHPESSSNRINYTPRKMTFISDLGKYRTEIHKAKQAIELLIWQASISQDDEKKMLYQECITKLNYVYANIAKTK